MMKIGFKIELIDISIVFFFLGCLQKEVVMDLKARTRKFGIDVLKFLKELKNDQITIHLKSQLVRFSTSVGANYRAACRAKSRPDFINKLKIVEEECDETIYFLEVIDELYPATYAQIKNLTKEGSELLAITVASIKTTRNNI